MLLDRRLALEQPDVATNRRQWGAELVRGIADKAPLRVQRLLYLAVGGLELGQHRVEGCRQPADLIRRPVVVHAPPEVARVADRTCRMRHSRHRAQRRAGQQPADAEGRHRRDAAAEEENRLQCAERLITLFERARDLEETEAAAIDVDRGCIDQEALALNRARFNPGISSLNGTHTVVAERKVVPVEILGAVLDGAVDGECLNERVGRGKLGRGQRDAAAPDLRGNHERTRLGEKLIAQRIKGDARKREVEHGAKADQGQRQNCAVEQS